jgi:ATP phosphoribosyltransferase
MTSVDPAPAPLRIGIPKGRMQSGVLRLLADAGIEIKIQERDYRPWVSLPELDVKILKPQNIIEMLAAGSRDLGFAGADWVAEMGVDLVDVLDTELDPVSLVAAAPPALLENGRLAQNGPLRVASEYEALTRDWLEAQGRPFRFMRSYGATEVFPPEDADCIVDLTATGATLRAHGLEVFDELMRSSTRLYANPQALEDPARKREVDRMVLNLRSVMEARRRVMLEVNVDAERLEQVVEVLPCMREATVSTLHGRSGYAVKVAVPRTDLPRVIPEVKARGGTDIVVTSLGQIVP